MPFHLVHGDITKLAVDAIVNAANNSLLGGGGVDGAIHRAAGPELLAECRTLVVVKPAKPSSLALSPACQVRDPHRGPIWRGGNHWRAGIAHRLLPKLSGTGFVPSLQECGLSLDLLRGLRLPQGPGSEGGGGHH